MKPSGPAIGVLLVLFILVVIVTCVFHDASRLENSQNGDSSPINIADSAGFTIYNQSNYTLETTQLEGAFEPPGPSPNVLNPGQNYNYQITFRSNTDRSAYIRYVEFGGNRNVSIDITLSTNNTHKTKTLTVTAIEGLSYSQNGDRLYIRNRYIP